jgi:hypothetical protein
MKTIKYSRFLDKMKIRGVEPLSEIHETSGVWKQNLTMKDIWQHIFWNTFNSSIIDGMLLTNLIVLASKFEVPKLNKIWSFFAW